MSFSISLRGKTKPLSLPICSCGSWQQHDATGCLVSVSARLPSRADSRFRYARECRVQARPRRSRNFEACEDVSGFRNISNFRFSLVLDSRKSGLTVKPDVLSRDVFKYSGRIPWRTYKKKLEVKDNTREFRRPDHLPRFIVSALSMP